MRLFADWNEFWFTPKSPASLGLYRVLLGFSFIVWAVLMAPPNLYVWYTESGPTPLSFYHLIQGNTIDVSLFGGITDPHQLLVIWLVFILTAFLFMIGFFTRSSALVLLVLFLSFNNRSPLILNSGDTMIRCCLFLMALAPCGRSCSVDRMIAIARGKDPGGDPALVELWTQRLLQFQVCLVYAATVGSKLSGKDWLNGTAVYYPLHMVEMVRFPLPHIFSTDLSINILTWGTLLVEISLATLVWNRRMRPYVLSGGILLHSGIEYALNVPLFSFVMVSSYMNFVYFDWLSNWTKTLSRWTSANSVSLFLPKGSLQSDPKWKVIERMDVLNLIHFGDIVDSPSVDLTVVQGSSVSTGVSAARRILLRLPALWILSPFISAPGSQIFLGPLARGLAYSRSFLNPSSQQTAATK